MAVVGQVYDRKQMSPDLVDNRKRENAFNMKMSWINSQINSQHTRPCGSRTVEIN